MVIVNGNDHATAEEKRLKQDAKHEKYWKRWGPYLSERQWGTVREDYSPDGDAWTSFPHDQARSRAYRWGEDGLGGISDNHQLICSAFSLWNGKDPILKERLFGLSGHEGNHGEDVKEMYYYLDSTPTHSYMKFLYKYPQSEFPYAQLIEENSRRDRNVTEFEILDTDAFDDERYWDVFVEYAKDADNEEEVLLRLTAYNRGPDSADLHVIPQVWFRNTWSWNSDVEKPILQAESDSVVQLQEPKLGNRWVQFSDSPGSTDDDADVKPTLLFTENETNFEEIWNKKSGEGKYFKDGFHKHIIQKKETVNNERQGTKMGAWYKFENVPSGECVVVRFKLTNKIDEYLDEEQFDTTISQRLAEADDFYWHVSPIPMADDLRNIQRQALGGMLWTKQFYMFIWEQWANGDELGMPPPESHKTLRNQDWRHMYAVDILSMPDKWEYPYFATWDTAFQCIPLAIVDPEFAKRQLDVLTREWYMSPSGVMPAYEWNFSDVNPPVHAWSVFRVFKIERKIYGREDFDFLERVFHKLLINFTWWVNRKDSHGKNVFEGGFLGLDNIGLFNRSEPLPTGGRLVQADATSWMAFYCLCMLNIALELAKHRRTYEDIASKFFEHFLLIADAMSYSTEAGQQSLWCDKDHFYYDQINWGGTYSQQLPIRSLVGLIPLYAVLTLEPEVLDRFPNFKKRLEWFIDHRRDLTERNIASMKTRGKRDRLLLALVDRDRLEHILRYMLDETEFLSSHGIRSLSKYHKSHPYSMTVNEQEFKVQYVPGDSNSPMFGGNSNWRGPIWLATTFLLIESLQRFHMFYGDTFKVECPSGSGDMLHLGEVAEEIQHRIQHIFAEDADGQRAYNGGNSLLNNHPNWREYIFFHEYFDADTGRGLGASHQLGWTGLVAKIIHDTGVSCRLPGTPRTPSTQASHYFDEVLYSKPRARPHHRRSNTGRSFVLRRSSTSSMNGTPINGDAEEQPVADNPTLDTSRRPDLRINLDATTRIEDELETRLDFI